MSLIWEQYNVKRKAPVRDLTGRELLKFFGACVLGAVLVWILLVAWPLLDRGSR